jgi:hypothetical protein
MEVYFHRGIFSSFFVVLVWGVFGAPDSIENCEILLLI